VVVDPRSGAGRRRDPLAGFVLIDLVATLAIIGLMIGLVFPHLAFYTTPTRMHLLLANTASLLRDARTAAIARDADATASFDASRRLIWSGTAFVRLPADVSLSVTSGGNCRSDGDVMEITFHPDGTNCGGVFRFVRGDDIFRLRVNWATGHVDVLKG
jgi:general secretion pathway protein H